MDGRTDRQAQFLIYGHISYNFIRIVLADTDFIKRLIKSALKPKTLAHSWPIIRTEKGRLLHLQTLDGRRENYATAFSLFRFDTRSIVSDATSLALGWKDGD